MKKISIVFEETDSEGGFQCYVAGLDRDIRDLPDEQLSPAEYWASTMFMLVGQSLQQSGIVQTVKQQKPPLKKDVH